MKLTIREVKLLIRKVISEGTIEVNPASLQPGDRHNGRTIASIEKSKNHVVITYDDGGEVKLRVRNLMNKQIPRIERGNTATDDSLPKIPLGWGKK